MTDSRATRRGQRELNEVRPPIELEQADFPELLHWDVPLSNASDEPTPGFTFESSMISANVPCEHGLILHNRSWRTIASRLRVVAVERSLIVGLPFTGREKLDESKGAARDLAYQFHPAAYVEL